MRLRCPKCQSDFQLLKESTVVEVKCPSCGSTVDLSGQETVTYIPPKLGHLGPFQLLEHIGRGHFGDVYKAKDSRLARIVAVKVPRTDDLSASERKAFWREARTAAGLRHPNIVTVHELGSAGDITFIASEFIDGVNLADVISGKKLPPRQAAEIAAKVGEALHHAHEQGVIHRDLKPRNIMLDSQGEPHLLDFGLAKHATGEFTITSEGDILGTPAYMAPEQARGDSAQADAKTDVYALGVSLYEMLVGRRPFEGNARGLIYQILHDEPDPPRKLNSDVSPDLETICLKAMSKQPQHRYATAKAMADDLRHFLAGEPIRARRTGPVERAWRWCRRNPAWAAAGSLAGVALIAVGLLLLQIGKGAAATAGTVKPIVRKAIELPVLKRDGALPSSPTSPADQVEAALWKLDAATGLPVLDQVERFKGKNPVTASLVPGDYLVVVVIPDHGFHEVLRHVPGDGEGLLGGYKHQWSKRNPAGVVELLPIEVPSVAVEIGMVPFAAAENVPIGSEDLNNASAHRRGLAAFLVDPTEVTVGEFSRYWTMPETLRLNPLPPEHAMRDVHWDIATGYAEKMGKRLLDEFEYEVAATNYGRQRFPWGDDGSLITEWQLGPVGTPQFDRTNTAPAVLGLYSNVAEWTSSWATPYPRERQLGISNSTAWHERVVRGGPGAVIEGNKFAIQELSDPRARYVLRTPVAKPGLGIRCGRSVRPRLQPGDFGQETSTSR